MLVSLTNGSSNKSRRAGFSSSHSQSRSDDGIDENMTKPFYGKETASPLAELGELHVLDVMINRNALEA
jgi:hypothetical protein